MNINQKVAEPGGNRPMQNFLLQDEALNYYPILIEYKGYKDKLVKLDIDGRVDNRTSKTSLITKILIAML